MAKMAQKLSTRSTGVNKEKKPNCAKVYLGKVAARDEKSSSVLRS